MNSASGEIFFRFEVISWNQLLCCHINASCLWYDVSYILYETKHTLLQLVVTLLLRVTQNCLSMEHPSGTNSIQVV